MKKRIIAAGLVLTALMLFTACTDPALSGSSSILSSSSVSGDSSSDVDSQPMSLTLDELAEFDGQDGSPAYVAVDGIIYDVTNANRWNEGVHENGVTAGRDLTTEIKEMSPHGLSVLENLPVIGELR